MTLQVIPANCTDVGGNIGLQMGIYEEPCPPSGKEMQQQHMDAIPNIMDASASPLELCSFCPS